VYRVTSTDGDIYFLKLRRGAHNHLGAVIPAFLARENVAPVIAPIPTLSAQLHSAVKPFVVTLYRFVEGADGYAVDPTPAQWATLGRALRNLHTVTLPARLRAALPYESYSPTYRRRVKRLQAHLTSRLLDDALSAELAALLRHHSASVDQLVEGAARLAARLREQPGDFCLCHGDIHNGNILITGSCDIDMFIVDWDTAVLATKERDLMFVGSGLGRAGRSDAADLFYAGYGTTAIDPFALAYYRSERIVEDIYAFCTEILAATEDTQDRHQALAFLSSQFESDGLVGIALSSLAAIEGT
jgi:spectinomycin phosphotransferase